MENVLADYPIISDVSAHIVKLLREKMCPEPVPSPNNIEVSSPAEQDVDYILGLYLYDIREEGEISMGPLRVGKTRLKKAPKPYSLYYMLFINGSSQMGLKAHDIQKIIGRAAQIVNDGNLIFPNTLQTWLESEEAPIILSPAKISLDDKVRVWSAINKPYQVSLFYKAAPVFLSSEIVVDETPVREASFTIQATGEKDS
ncbi:MAG: DUF4255 domain-containing protein [Clostridiales Family XIII bacterium]|jgi:hypothetical protein|nr:DUF4255 domain-containing protein [Clostridiales Family XIII bacterium]